MSFSRRSFLRGVSGAVGLATAAAGAKKFSLLERAADAATLGGYAGYRAVVGVFLLGGNDSNNMIIPITNYAQYAAHRTAADIGIPQASLLSLGAGTYGLHPAMDKLQSLFNGTDATVGNQKGLALVFNVGTLATSGMTVATARTLIGAGQSTGLPDHLFSHIDQQHAWASGVPDPLVLFNPPMPAAPPNTGWGGRAADLLGPLNPLVGVAPNQLSYPPVTYYSGPAVFGAGGSTDAISVASNGTLALSSSGNGNVNTVRLGALNQIMSAQMNSNIAPVDAFHGAFGDALAYSAIRTAARTNSKLPNQPGTATSIAALFPNTTLGNQLLHIVEDIWSGAAAATNGLGQRRQIFAASLGGFDTHTNELSVHNSLYAQLDDAFYAFYKAVYMMKQLNPNLQVTLFTMSDFGRTFLPNSSGGTDHGWGSHMLVLGDQVKGGLTYGTFPDLRLLSDNAAAANDVGEGRWLPHYSADQYSNTFARWLGTQAVDDAYLFPRLAGFTGKTIGFI